jgi:hypothetical protein
MPTFTQAIAQRRAQLAAMKSSISLAAGQQTTHSRSIQQDSAQPLQNYPVAGAAPIVICTYRVPPKMSGAITGLAIVHLGAAGSFQDGSGNVVWRMLVNGVPQKGLEAIYAQLGALTQVAPMFLLLRPGDLVQVTAQVPALKVSPVGQPFARLAGYLDFGGLGSQPPQGGVTSIGGGGGTGSLGRAVSRAIHGTAQIG